MVNSCRLRVEIGSVQVGFVSLSVTSGRVLVSGQTLTALLEPILQQVGRTDPKMHTNSVTRCILIPRKPSTLRPTIDRCSRKRSRIKTVNICRWIAMEVQEWSRVNAPGCWREVSCWSDHLCLAFALHQRWRWWYCRHLGRLVMKVMGREDQSRVKEGEEATTAVAETLNLNEGSTTQELRELLRMIFYFQILKVTSGFASCLHAESAE